MPAFNISSWMSFRTPPWPSGRFSQPVVSELMAGDEGERAAVVVADPKQSIYGWRGARPSLVPFVQERYGLEQEKLEKSFRSGPVILDVVRETFSGPGKERGGPGDGWWSPGGQAVAGGSLPAGIQ